MVKVPSLVTFAKCIGAACLSGVVFWQVAQHSGASRGTAIVHVSEAHVVVSLDDRDYLIDTVWELPLLCELPPGQHVLRMKRGERVVYKEEFSVKPGEEVVLTAWDPGSAPRSPLHLTPQELRSIGLPSVVTARDYRAR